MYYSLLDNEYYVSFWCNCSCDTCPRFYDAREALDYAKSRYADFLDEVCIVERVCLGDGSDEDHFYSYDEAKRMLT